MNEFGWIAAGFTIGIVACVALYLALGGLREWLIAWKLDRVERRLAKLQPKRTKKFDDIVEEWRPKL